MSEKQEKSEGSKPFLTRAKAISEDEFTKLKEQIDRENRKRKDEGLPVLSMDSIIIDDTRRKIFHLAPVAGEFLRSKEANDEFKLLLRIQKKEAEGYKVLNVISEPIEIRPAKKKSGDITQKGNK